MSKLEKTAIAVIGVGYWGKNLVRNFHELGALAAIVDYEQRILQERANQYPDIPTFTNTSDVLANPDIHAVAIATPAETHGNIVAQALEAGKHVFVEKPLCLDVRVGRELINLAESKSRTLMVGHLLHYHPAIVKCKEMIAAGIIGRMQYIYSNRLNLGKVRREENILWSFAPHDISILLSLTEEMPIKAVCMGGNYLRDNVADTTVSYLDFPSGVKSHIFVSWLHPFKEQKLVVIGSEGMVVFDDTQPTNKLLLYSHRVRWEGRIPIPVKQEPEIIELENAEPLKNECMHFIECTRTGLRPLTNGEEGLRVLSVLDACQRSLNNGGGDIFFQQTDAEIQCYKRQHHNHK